MCFVKSHFSYIEIETNSLRSQNSLGVAFFLSVKLYKLTKISKIYSKTKKFQKLSSEEENLASVIAVTR